MNGQSQRNCLTSICSLARHWGRKPQSLPKFAVASSDWKSGALAHEFVETDREQASHAVETWAHVPVVLSSANRRTAFALHAISRSPRRVRFRGGGATVGRNAVATEIDKFREHFAATEGQYSVIGGAACDLLFDPAALNLSATHRSTWHSAWKLWTPCSGRPFKGSSRQASTKSGTGTGAQGNLPLSPSDRPKLPLNDRVLCTHATDLNLP